MENACNGLPDDTPFVVVVHEGDIDRATDAALAALAEADGLAGP